MALCASCIFTRVRSISFISSIVSLEEEFNIEFPDEYLLIEKMNNINNICLIIESLLGS